MKIKAITVLAVLALSAGYTAQADLLDQLRNRTGGVFGGGAGGGAGGDGGGETIPSLSEVEPNDTPQTATSLAPGQMQSGVFQTDSDQDWYRFRVTQAGTAATLELPPQRRGFRLTLQTGSGQVLARFQNDDKDTRRFAVVLPQLGDFFLVAESLGASRYTFTLAGDGIGPPITGPGGLPEGALTEIEPNDGPQAATALKPNAFHGGFLASGDQDWFRFQVTAAGAVEVFLPGSSGEFTLELLDAAGRALASQRSAGFDQTFTVVASTPGDYFARLSSQAKTHYLFKLTGQTLALPLDRRNEFLRQAQREVEPNDHLLSANPIIPGQPVAGQLRSKEDEDFFALRTVQDNAQVNVEVPKGPAKWQVSLWDALGNLLYRRESATDSDLVFAVTIEHAGKFYLSIAAVDDSRADYTFNVTGQGLQNPNDRTPNANFHNVEIEPNDTLEGANPVTSAVRLLGQLRTGSEIDLFKLESPGNEILSVALCPENADCAGQFSNNSGPWVVYVFDANLTQRMLDQTVTLTKCVDAQSGSVDQSPTKHLYLALNTGFLDSALLGVIDPAFGNSRRLEIGLRNPGTYFLAVSSPLRWDETGSVILKKENVTCGKIERTVDGETVTEDRKITETRIEVSPFSDDPYELKIVQTGLTPAISSTSAQSQAFLPDTVYVPLVEVNGVEYSAQLRLLRLNGKLWLELVGAEPIGTAVAATDAEALKREAMRATIAGDIVHIPLAVYDGHYYAGELRMFAENGRTLFELISAKRLD